MNLDNFIKECKELPVSLALQKTVSLGNGSYKILCETSKKNPKFAEVKKAVSKLFDNKVSVVAGTVQNKTSSLVSLIVKANVRSIAYKDGKLPEGKKLVTASIAADVNDNSIWEVQGSGEDKRLVLKADDDFEKIFQHNNRICTAALKVEPVAVESGDYISYYDSKANCIKAGYAIVSEDDDITVIDQNMEETEVDPEEVLESADLTDLEKNPVEAAFNAGDKSKVSEYMAKLYKDTDFFKKLNELMGVRVSEGADGKFYTTMVTAGYEENIDQIKQEIKDFLVNDSIEELRNDVLNTEIDEVDDEVEGNVDGDIDFAEEEEIETYPEEAEAEEGADPGVEVPENDMTEDEIVENDSTIDAVEEIPEDDLTDETISELLDEEDIDVTTEAELDEGDFEDVNTENVTDGDLDSEMDKILEEDNEEE